jgi:hypothetical protein
MSEVVIVPTYKRDELLFLCLEAIRREDQEIRILVFSDHCRQSDDIANICDEFLADFCPVADHNSYGNSFAVISALRVATRGKFSAIHLIEDDTILHPGYLDWARRSLSGNRFAAVCGHVGNTLDTWYTSPCASWNADRLAQCLALVPTGYLEATTREEMQKILDEFPVFKKSKFRYGSAEQDGFLLRCIEHFGWKTLFPDKPMCVHLGAWGYNRPSQDGPQGSFDERVQACRDLLANKQKRVELFGQRIVELEMEGANQ